MRQKTVTKDEKQFTRINKTKARRLFDQGKRIYLLPCNVRFDNMWISPCPIDKDLNDSDPYNIRSFDTIVNSFEYYNCIEELGKYAAYFIKA